MNSTTDLEYLVNPAIYDKIFKKKTTKITRDDIKFYRKRVIQLTRDLQKPSLAKSYPPSLQHAFKEYLSSIFFCLCISIPFITITSNS